MATHQAGPENLESLLQSTVQPGDTVELRGEFTKPIKLQVSRVTLRPADLNAPPTIKSTIRLAQPEQKVLGLKVVPGASAAAIEVAAPGCEVGWCEITGFAARGIVIGKTGTGAHVHHNWVHDQAALTGAAVAGIIAGTGRGTSATPIQALIEFNRLEKLKAFQAIEFKSSRNKARGNTVIGAEIVMRHGNDNRTEGNWVKDGLIGLCGERPVSAFDHVFGETASRGPSGIALRAGTIDSSTPQAGQYIPARDAIVCDTSSDIIDGWVKGNGVRWTEPPVNSGSARHTGTVKDAKCPGGVSPANVQNSAAPAPRELTADEVGPKGLRNGGQPSGFHRFSPNETLADLMALGESALALERARAASGDLDEKVRDIRQADNSAARKQAEDKALAGLKMLRDVVKGVAGTVGGLTHTGVAAVAEIAQALTSAHQASGNLDNRFRDIRQAAPGAARKDAENRALAGLKALRGVVKDTAVRLRALEPDDGDEDEDDDQE